MYNKFRQLVCVNVVWRQILTFMRIIERVLGERGRLKVPQVPQVRAGVQAAWKRGVA